MERIAENFMFMGWGFAYIFAILLAALGGHKFFKQKDYWYGLVIVAISILLLLAGNLLHHKWQETRKSRPAAYQSL